MHICLRIVFLGMLQVAISNGMVVVLIPARVCTKLGESTNLTNGTHVTYVRCVQMAGLEWLNVHHISKCPL